MLNTQRQMKASHFPAGGSSVIQTLPVCSPRLKMIRSRPTAMSGAPNYRFFHDSPLLWKC